MWCAFGGIITNNSNNVISNSVITVITNALISSNFVVGGIINRNFVIGGINGAIGIGWWGVVWGFEGTGRGGGDGGGGGFGGGGEEGVVGGECLVFEVFARV
jgi:hypothetical protein